MDNPKISIIVPIYKAERYFRMCLDSLVNQTYRNIEIVLVDDGSPDNCGAICDEYAARDDRIKVIHKENGGTLLARKTGVFAATGDYIWFMDPDDTAAENACEILAQKIVETGVDIIAFGMEVKTPQGHDYDAERWFSKHPSALYGREIVKECIVKDSYTWNVANKIFKVELCKKAHLEVPDCYCIMAEDVCAYFIMACFAKTFAGIEDKLYQYRIGIGVSKRSGLSVEGFEKQCGQAEVVKMIRAFLERNHIFDAYEEEFWALDRRLLEACVISYWALPTKCQDEGMSALLKAWGLERENDILAMVDEVQRENEKEVVLQQFAAGKIGFRYIARYFLAWLKFKLRLGPR